ncbi:flagellar filament capping protein FliD [Caulobacter sp. KR2-114]|uniref:flagellar filament capping protein FliD n=1 Tax=Caulobacter sp. KR2-114 TaxID=3400912 RepID=UPI003C0AEE53
MTSTSATTSSGAVVTSGSTTYIASSASGLDTASLVSAAVATKTKVADSIDAQVTANKNRISAYADVQTLLNALSSSVDALASAANLSSGTTSAWAGTTASVTASDGAVTAGNIPSVDTTGAAAAGSYDITVSQLAKSMKVAGAAMAQDSALNLAGSFTLSAADGTAATIQVTAGMSLSDVAGAINAQSATTGVDATLVQVSSGSYRLVLSGADTGQAISAAAASGGDVLGGLGLTGADGAFATVLQPAQDAVFTLDGTSISSASNTVANVLPGVTLNLSGVTTGSDTLTMTIGQDTSAVTSAVQAFISAYNNLHDYMAAQESVGSDGAVASTAYLFADSTLRALNTALGGLLTGGSGASGATIGHLSQLGVTFDGSNDLQLSDPAALADALSSNAAAVQGFFQSSYTTSNSALRLIGNSGTGSLSFTLDITADANGVTGATVNGQSGLFTVSGNELIGAAGTPYAGLTLAINASADTSISVTLNQGLADSLVNLARQFGDTSGGLIQTQISGLTATDSTLSARSSSIRSDADAYQTQLINKYAKMETEISAAQIVQQEIQAVLNAKSN